MAIENDSTGRVWLHQVVLPEFDELCHVRVDDLRDLRRAGVDRADRLAIVPSRGPWRRVSALRSLSAIGII